MALQPQKQGFEEQKASSFRKRMREGGVDFGKLLSEIQEMKKIQEMRSNGSQIHELS